MWTKKMMSLIMAVGIAYGVVCLALFFMQKKLLYFPTPEMQVPGVTHMFLDTGEVRIKVWTLQPGREKAMLYFGGNAEDVASDINDFSILFPDRTVYLVNYRGYGGSSGVPGEKGFYKDALLVYDYFSKRHKATAAMGRSIGSAVATFLASQRPLDKLILVTPMDSIVNVAEKLYPFFPVGVLLQERYDSMARASGIRTDVLIVASRDDEIVPFENSQRLAGTMVNAHVQFAELSEAGHNTIHFHPAYRALIHDFMQGQ